MNTLRSLAAIALLGSVASLTACSSATEPPQDPAERIGNVKSALSSPTGTVDADSAPEALAGFHAELDFAGIEDLIGGLSGGAGGWGAAAGCSKASTSGGDVDLSCSSDVGGGKVTYEVKVQTGTTGASTYVSFALENVCEGSTCSDGTIVIATETGVSGVTTTMEVDVDLTSGGETNHAHFGVSTSAGEAGSSVDVAVFDDAGDSYVVHATAGGATSVEIEGANGTFSCDVDASGASGTCSGAGDFSF